MEEIMYLSDIARVLNLSYTSLITYSQRPELSQYTAKVKSSMGQKRWMVLNPDAFIQEFRKFYDGCRGKKVIDKKTEKQIKFTYKEPDLYLSPEKQRERLWELYNIGNVSIN